MRLLGKVYETLSDPFVLFPSWLLFAIFFILVQWLIPPEMRDLEILLKGEMGMGLGTMLALGALLTWVWCTTFLVAWERVRSGRAPEAVGMMRVALLRLPTAFLALYIQGLVLGLAWVVGGFLGVLPALALFPLVLFGPALVFAREATPLEAFRVGWRMASRRYGSLLGDLALLGVVFLAALLAMVVLAALALGLPEEPTPGLFIAVAVAEGAAFPLLSTGWAVLCLKYRLPTPTPQPPGTPSGTGPGDGLT